MCSKYIESSQHYTQDATDPPAVFLAGVITACPDWQTLAADALSTAPCVVLNPRRSSFDHTDPGVASEQIAWEHHHLGLPRVLSLFWFPACGPAAATQPIALFELGGGLERRTLNRPVLVGADADYPRRSDVVEQLRHIAPDLDAHDDLDHLILEARVLIDPDYALHTESW